MEPRAINSDPAATGAAGRSEFPTTHWTLVTRVREGGPVRQAALEELCRLYWYPIYAFLRRRGHAQHDAEDLTQGFFVKLLVDESLSAAEAGKGRLRTYLLQHLKRHLADQRRVAGALKRGGGVGTISFEALEAEERYAREPLDLSDPELLFARTWAHELLSGVRQALRSQFEDPRRPEAFDVLLPFLLLDDDPPSYRDVAARLRATEAAVRLMVHRLRETFRTQLRQEIARTVENPGEVEGELKWLRTVLSGTA